MLITVAELTEAYSLLGFRELISEDEGVQICTYERDADGATSFHIADDLFHAADALEDEIESEIVIWDIGIWDQELAEEMKIAITKVVHNRASDT